MQGQGIATEMAQALESLYAQGGVKYISVHANIDVGGYTWAKQGFEWDPLFTSAKDIDRLVSVVEVAGADPGLTAQWRYLLKNESRDAWPTPWDLAMAGWEPGLEMWPGKKAMLGSEWMGRKTL